MGMRTFFLVVNQQLATVIHESCISIHAKNDYEQVK